MDGHEVAVVKPGRPGGSKPLVGQRGQRHRALELPRRSEAQQLVLLLEFNVGEDGFIHVAFKDKGRRYATTGDAMKLFNTASTAVSRAMPDFSAKAMLLQNEMICTTGEGLMPV